MSQLKTLAEITVFPAMLLLAGLFLFSVPATAGTIHPALTEMIAKSDPGDKSLSMKKRITCDGITRLLPHLKEKLY